MSLLLLFPSVAGEPDISNDLDIYDFGTLVESATPVTGLDYFTVTNNSAFAVNITIGATDMTGGVGWTLADDATPDVNTYGLKAGLNGGDYTIVVRKTPAYNALKAGLGAGLTQKWGLQLFAPTGMTDGIGKSGVVTLYAAAV